MPRTQSERQEMRDKHPDSWIAVSEGDTVAGEVTDVTDAWSDQRRNSATGRPGSYYPLLTIKAVEATGYKDLPRELKVHGFGAVLYNEIMRKRPDIGERIRITYKGVGEAKVGQNPPELYVLRSAAGAEVAKRAYDNIGGVPAHPGTVQPIPVETSDFVQSELPETDDIPY